MAASRGWCVPPVPITAVSVTMVIVVLGVLVGHRIHRISEEEQARVGTENSEGASFVLFLVHPLCGVVPPRMSPPVLPSSHIMGADAEFDMPVYLNHEPLPSSVTPKFLVKVSFLDEAQAKTIVCQCQLSISCPS